MSGSLENLGQLRTHGFIRQEADIEQLPKLAPTERQLKNGISPITGVPDHIQSHTAIQSGGPTGFRFRGRQSMIQVGLQSLNDTEGFIE